LSTATAFDRRDFRNCLGMFPTGVAVVTTVAPSGAFVGLTINSFASVSLDPPLVLWSLHANSPSMGAFDRASHFAVNILADDQVELSRRFASPQPHKFSGLKVNAGAGDVPLLEGCVATIECKGHARHTGGDHLIFVGHVERFCYDPQKRPLVFHGGRYCTAGQSLP
jgi:flavin reductase (DIM6/NTAB) family NADH-FMN oxidoreductase RutF